jgi:hypothetical protein
VIRFTFLALAFAGVTSSMACNSQAPPRGPEETCARACEGRVTACTREECWRGCNLVLDRLAEHEGDRVLACVANETRTASAAHATGATGPTGGKARACDDRLWAWCAVRIGEHADGGPPAAPPPRDFEDEE